jgi:hypothetical protein
VAGPCLLRLGTIRGGRVASSTGPPCPRGQAAPASLFDAVDAVEDDEAVDPADVALSLDPDEPLDEVLPAVEDVDSERLSVR